MKEIIAADPIKEVLHLRATFGQRRETIMEFIEATTQGNICSNSHSTNYVCWAKEGDYEGDHRG